MLGTTDWPGQSVVEHKAAIVGMAGAVFVITATASDAGLSPQTLLRVAVYRPSVATVILAPVSPVDQCTVQSGHKFSAISTTDSPAQNAVGPEAVTAGVVGRMPIVTETGSETGLSSQVLLTKAV